MLAVQLLAKPFLDDIPAVAGFGIGLEIFQSLVEDFAVPFRDGNRLGSCRDTVSQRLQIVDLLVDRRCVETGRRQRHRFWLRLLCSALSGRHKPPPDNGDGHPAKLVPSKRLRSAHCSLVGPQRCELCWGGKT
jgi:hypothetical protein